MNTPPERIGPIARLAERDPLPDALRHQFAASGPEHLEFAIQHLPPMAVETFAQLRRMKEEILVWRRRLGSHLRAS
ncbi:MAG TPA: hypothetical protein PKV72_01065 [Candidatus Peribacteria bacterium]|nr:hypothetical protein [Candidatus Peribacteria bacterium]